MKFTSVVLACLAALLMCNLAVSGMEVTMSPAESILLEAAQRHSAEAALASHSDSETDVAVDSHILSDAEAEAQARFEAEFEGASDLESAQEVDAEELAAAEEAAALDADADIEDRMEMDSEMDSEADSFAEMDAEADAEDEAELQAHQQEEFMAGQSALLEVSQAPQAPSSFSGPPSSSYSNPPPGPSDYQGPPPSFAPGAPAPQYNAPFQQQAAGPFGGPNAAQSGPPADLPSGLPPVGHDIPLPPGTNPNAPFAQDQEIVSKGVKAKTVVVKVPNPAAAGKFLKVRVPLPTKGKLAKKLAQGKGKKALGKQLKKALKQALGKSKLSKAEKKAVKKAAKKAVKKAKKAAKKAKKAAKKAKKAKKLSKKARRAAKLKRAATKAATLNAKLLPKGQYTKRWTTIQVPNPAKAGKTTAAKVQVQVPIAGEADHTLRKIKAVIPKVEHRKLQIPGQKKPQEIKVTRYYKALRQAVVDPVNAGEVRTIDVQVEVKAPAQKPAAAIDNVSKLLEKKIKKKEKNIKALQRGLRTARRNVADSPVLEDGAPAPPDRQQVEMAQNLMKVLEATVLGRAKEIGEKYLNDARDMTVIADANHEAVQDFNIRMNAENVLPKETIDFGL